MKYHVVGGVCGDGEEQRRQEGEDGQKNGDFLMCLTSSGSEEWMGDK